MPDTAPRQPEPPGQRGPATHDIVIVGGGFSGICMGIRLLGAGITDFVILERATDVGGTWRDNDYPGCACDIPSHLYSFSFETKHDWSRLYPPQAEIQDYLRACVRKYGLEQHILLRSRVVEARYEENRLQWRVRTADGIERRCRVLVSGMGGLSRPAIPAIPGLGRFSGACFHSARWDHAFRLAGQRVAVIGTGASAIQFVPKIADSVARLTVFQRTAPWIVPKLDRPISGWEQRLYRAVPLARYLHRNVLYWRQELRGIGFTIDPRLMSRARRIALKHLRYSVPDPDLRARLTPEYVIGCKRILISNDYYPSLQREHVTLITAGIREITASGVIDGAGRLHEVDAIILGTGFHATAPLGHTRIFGLNGRELADDWREGPEAYYGVGVAGYPNLFLLMGPNTGLGHNSMIFMIETQVRYVVRLLQRMRMLGLTAVDVRGDCQRDFNRGIARRMARTVWVSGCRSWYQTADGRHPVLWPGSTVGYWRRMREPELGHYHPVTQPAPPIEATTRVAGEES